jgi:phosphoribosylformylglycinamidine synthase
MTLPPAHVAVILFPGSNCEQETARAVDAAGMCARIVRWNETIRANEFDGYILPGGWSYEDRIRAGAIAAHDDVMRLLRDEADQGKPVLGVCNGAQILAEAGLIPGVAPRVQVALAPNEQGYRCAWVTLRLIADPSASVFTRAFEPDAVIHLPVANGEGRFTTAQSDASWLGTCAVFRYATPDGTPSEMYPHDPSGSLYGIAALKNAAGNVMGIMPHPERASWWHQHPPAARPDAPTPMAPAHTIFASMRQSIEATRVQ